MTFLNIQKLQKPTQLESTDLGQIVSEVLDDLEVKTDQKKASIEVGKLPVLEAEWERPSAIKSWNTMAGKYRQKALRKKEPLFLSLSQ